MDVDAGPLILNEKDIRSGRFWNQSSTQLTMDVDLYKDSLDVWCLPLVVHHQPRENDHHTPHYTGIILIETSERKDEYKRIGCFQLDENRGNNFLQLQGGYRSTPTYSVFTIV